MKERILIVEDDPEQCELLEKLVARLDYVPIATTFPEDALELIARERFDAVLTDLEMGAWSGVELCKRIVAARSDVPVIFVTGVGSMPTAVAALRAGAYDFLSKPFDANVLGLALKRAIDHRKLTAEVKLLRDAARAPRHADFMIGESLPVLRVKDLVGRIGPSDVSVLIEGETGTGKELVARAVHDASPRKARPFVAINCAAVPATLLESELFGHAKGAFTDAKTAREGLFVQASGGTLLLDEIGEMPLEMQTKLLRALQERTVRPVGANRDIAFDTRVIAATHRNLENEIAKRAFREDLYYRLNVVKLVVPPLRARGNDVLLLATHFLWKASLRTQVDISLSPQVAAMLIAYDWPGNVRELENCIERAVALARFNQISAEDIPERIRNYRPRQIDVVETVENEVLSLDELERRYILHALKVLDGNRSRAAMLLGLDRRTLCRRLDKYEEHAASMRLGANEANERLPHLS